MESPEVRLTSVPAQGHHPESAHAVRLYQLPHCHGGGMLPLSRRAGQAAQQVPDPQVVQELRLAGIAQDV